MALAKLKKLKYLDIRNNRNREGTSIIDIPVEIYAALADCKIVV